MKNLAINYFSKLLNSTVDENTVIRLSSGQSARAFAWLRANDIIFDDQRLSANFSINEILGFTNNLKSSSIQPKEKIHSAGIQITTLSTSVSIGVDIQSISELFPEGLSSDPKSDPELLGIYSIKELSYAQSRPDPVQTLTGLFAAKEAILKCGQNERNLTNLEILPDLKGKPTVDGFLISISHSLDYAVAIAIPTIRMENEKHVPVEKLYPLLSEIKGVEKKSKMNTVFDFFIPAIVFILVTIEIVRLLN